MHTCGGCEFHYQFDRRVLYHAAKFTSTMNELENYEALETYAYCLRDISWLSQVVDDTINLFIDIRH